ncbi:helix-turn-helix domain-containing protein [Halomicroarcula sp. GCM10025324]|uniref:helix-turn-helix domain-containing protein n=1 Tax=Haloarcula TaxID=2237 RepID=UPI0023E8456B|nr:helix-turn-helix domain-containing protein [Halomicroarcula sp. ZS-22-S1]
MATLAEFTIDYGAFPFDAVFESFQDATIEIERLIPTGDAILPYIWVSGPEGEQARESLTAAAALADVDVIDQVGDRSLLRCEYVTTYEGVLGAIIETGVSLLSANGTIQGWTVQVRGIEPGAIAKFDRACRDLGIDLTLTELHELSASGDYEPAELTAAQREALLLAYELGFFDEPRTATLEDVAAELGISRQAVANRLRRGHRALIREMLSETG